MKRAVWVSVGEKHSLALQRWSAAQLPGLERIPWLEDAAYSEPDPAVGDTMCSRATGSLFSTPRSGRESDTSGHLSMHSPERFASELIKSSLFEILSLVLNWCASF